MTDERLSMFFSVFPTSTQDEILDFCRRISKTKADIYIFLARKAAVFCNCLEELGQIHLDGYVTTDRSLDIGGKWLNGKDVVIIDDAVVSGTTLFSTIQKMKKYGTRSIAVQILTINKRWFNHELLEKESGESYIYPVYNELPDNLCIKLCNDIVQAISLVPRPYDIDFPLFRTISIPEYALNRIIVLNNWYSYDIRSERQKDYNIINLSLVPGKNELRELSNAFGLDITRNCIVKIRIYGRLIDKNKRSYSLRISPIIVFNEMEIETVQSIFDQVVSVSGAPSLFANWCSTAQLRFLQFYYSNHLAMYWLHQIKPFVPSLQKLLYSYRNLSFLFPEELIEPIERLCSSLVKLSIQPQTSIDTSLRVRDPQSVYQSVDPISINARLYEPFWEMYHEKELPCRALVLEHGKSIFQKKKYKTIINRLNEGLSFQDIAERLRDCVNDYDIEKKVSEFIDRSIDAGIIVPIIQQEGTTIFRAYRHGEDVLFGCREELMYRKMLSLFAEHSGARGGISKMEVEKLLVLFTKIGLKEKILYPYTSSFASEPLDRNGRPMKILRVKPYLKGPVSLVGTALQFQANRYIPYVTTERKSLWMTYVLLQNGALKQNANKKNYQIGTEKARIEADFALLTEPEQSFVENFAELTGKISNPEIDTGIVFDDTDWARVSVTLTLPDTVTAVAAEMEIFYNEFNLVNLFSFTGSRDKDFKQIKYFVSGHAFESVHSAVMKIESFINSRGKKLINGVRFSSNLEQRTWLGYFSDEMSNHLGENNSFLKLTFYEQQIWSYLLQGLVNALYILLLQRHRVFYQTKNSERKGERGAAARLNEAIDKLDNLRSCLTTRATNAKRLYEVYDRIHPLIMLVKDNSIEDYSTAMANIMSAISDSDSAASIIKENVCGILGERGKVNDIILFNYAVHINLDFCPEDKRVTAYSCIENAYKDGIKRIEANRQYAISKGKPVPALFFAELPQKHKPIPTTNNSTPGIWYISSGPKVDFLVAKFAMNVFYLLYQNDLNCRVTIFDRLSYEHAIRSSASENAEYHCNQFNTLMESFKRNILFPEGLERFPLLTYVTDTATKSKSSIPETIQNADCFKVKDTYLIGGPSSAKSNYRITEYECIEKRQIVKRENVEFGIITILPEELSAIADVFQLKKKDYKFGERAYYRGYVHSSKVNASREVICTQALAQGESSVINAYHEMIHNYHPKIIFLIGIAGGVQDDEPMNQGKAEKRKELDLCDVVIARSIIDYELRKENEASIQHRGVCYSTNAAVTAVINEFLVDIQKTAISSAKDGKNDTINVLFDAIGSGNAVIANRLSSILEWLKNFNSKVAAVEMEAAGISSAFYESFGSNSKTKGLLVVRGISDLADVDKALCKAYRIPAARNAALVSKRIMESFPSFD